MMLNMLVISGSFMQIKLTQDRFKAYFPCQIAAKQLFESKHLHLLSVHVKVREMIDRSTTILCNVT